MGQVMLLLVGTYPSNVGSTWTIDIFEFDLIDEERLDLVSDVPGEVIVTVAGET